ncbi:MAG: Hpt domain-containing protein [Gammaproteobacteria bacterium]|nr:Hpt domain-containing protein [Gammaproteobacteria bacterium]
MRDATISEQTVETDSSVDFEILKNMRKAMGVLFVDIVDAFFEQSASYLVELEEAFSSSEIQVMERIFHSLASSSASFGANKLSTMARDLEYRIRDSGSSVASEEICSLQKEYLVVEKILKTFLVENIQ